VTCATPGAPGPSWAGAASTLLAPLLDGPPRHVHEVARTRLSVHYATEDPSLPLLCVVSPEAIRLPAAVVTSTLPGHGGLQVGAGMLESTDATWRITRWWRPPRPAGLEPPPHLTGARGVFGALRAAGDPAVLLPPSSYDGLDPATLLGRGPGLTPSGDDVLAAALVTAHATSDPRLDVWRRRTRAALTATATTPVSHGLLHAALDGWCTPELAAFLDAVCTPGMPGPALTLTVERLLEVGHSSGAALALGVLHTLTTRDLRGAA